MRKYTEKIHAARVKKMMEMGNPYMRCPAGKRYQTGWAYYNSIWSTNPRPCDICREFVNIDFGCPCIRLGEQEAIKCTWIALEKKGYNI